MGSSVPVVLARSGHGPADIRTGSSSCLTMTIAATILMTMGLGHRVAQTAEAVELKVEPESVIEPV